MVYKMRTVLALAFLLGDLTNGKVKDPDEDKAYEFGFTIEGMQHRHEKKDVNGIIQGEFGFITADGVYHVTVYATDENGNFRIISMKNIKVSPPLDGSPDFGSKQYSSIPKGQQVKSNQASLPKTSVQSIQPQDQPKFTPTKRPFRAFTTQPTHKPSCAGCGYVTTSKKPPLQSVTTYNNVVATSPENFRTAQNKEKLFSGDKSQNGISTGVSKPFKSSSDSKYSGLEDSKQLGPRDSENVIRPQVTSSNEPSTIRSDGYSGKIETPTKNGVRLSPGIFENRFGDVSAVKSGQIYSDSQTSLPLSNSNSKTEQNQILGRPNQVQITSKSDTNPGSVKVSNGLIHIPGNPDIPIKDRYPGMVDGLPPGINEKDITTILYRFNWTVGFQGHYETGYKNGAKVGGYFVNGSDGISRVVTYVADEFGYRPKVRIINIGLDSPDTPKDDKTFELKSFEFVWYPVQ